MKEPARLRVLSGRGAHPGIAQAESSVYNSLESETSRTARGDGPAHPQPDRRGHLLFSL